MAPARKPHIVAFPSFPYGHVHPMMLFCEALATSGNVNITFVHTQLNHKSVRLLQPRNPNINNVELSGELPLEDLSNPRQMISSLEERLRPQLQQLIVDFNHTDSPVTCFIADLCWPWPHALAKKLNIPLIAGFTPFCMATLYVNHYIPHLISTGQVLPNGTPIRDTFSLPAFARGLPSARRPWRLGTEEEDAVTLELTISAMEGAKDLKYILCNTCYDWESNVADALSKELPIFPVGPLFLAAADEKINSSTASLSQEAKECLQWLDKQAASSVVYIAFGSISSLSSVQIQELSLGLEACGSPFLWVSPRISDPDLPDDGKAADLFPKGFVERTKGRAHFVSWAPQTSVLMHRAIGCYLCHSGWNSLAESICLGVPMLAMSFLGDQRMNYWYLVEEWGVAKALRAEDEDGELSREQVEKAIRCVMSDGEEGKEIRKRVRKLKDEAIAAVKDDGGSSNKNLQAFIQDIIKHSSAAI